MLVDLVRVVVALVVAAPLPFAALVWWAAAARARSARMPWAWLGPLAVAVWLHKNRRDLRGVVMWSCAVAAAAVWVVMLWRSPGLRFAVGVAIPAGVAAGVLVWLASNYPHLPPHLAVRFAVAERRSRDVVSDAVAASVGDGAKVLSVVPLDGGQFEATIGGPAGMSHADLLDHLRDTLAESIRALSGRAMSNVSVVGKGPKGTALVRCSTTSPYSRTVTLEDL